MTRDERRAALVERCERKRDKYERKLRRAESAHTHVD